MYGRQSCIDRMYTSRGLGTDMYTYTQWCQCLDHSAIISAITTGSKGPSQWHLPEDILDLPQVKSIVMELLILRNTISHRLHWELFKSELRSQIQ